MRFRLSKRINLLIFLSVLLLLTVFQMLIIPVRAPFFDSDVTVIPSSPSEVDKVNVTVVFHFTSSPPGAGFGNPTQVGNTFSVNVTVYDTIGYRLHVLHDDEHTYHLGKLQAGSYQFNVYVEERLDGFPLFYGLEQSVPFTVRINVPGDYPTIQAAINAANPGDTIFVSSGIYPENLVVNKSLTLIGENKSTTIIDGGGSGDVIYLYSYINISGFTIQNGSHGIRMYPEGHNNTIIDNIIKDNEQEGIMTGWWYGNNTILNNTILNNGQAIFLSSSEGGPNVLRENKMIGNRYGLTIHEGHHYGSWPYSDIDTSNTVDGKPVYYLVNQSNLVIDPSTFPEIGYLGIAYSTNVVVRDLSISKSGQGIFFCDTENLTVQNVTVTNNEIGIDLYACNWGLCFHSHITDSKILNNKYGVLLQCTSRTVVRNNMILNNSIYGVLMAGGCVSGNIIEYNVISNGGYGIYSGSPIAAYSIHDNTVSNNTYGICLDFIYSGPPIKIYHNNFINNTNQLFNLTSLDSSDWQYQGIGNYWSDYNGTDLNGDGIGDTNLPWQKVDNYPLMNPWRCLCQFSHPITISIYQMRLEIDTYFPNGSYLMAKFLSYSGLYQCNVTVWNGTTPAHVNLPMNVSHPLNLPIENVTLILVNEAGTIRLTVTSFVIHRSHLIGRLGALDYLWTVPGTRIPEGPLFREMVDIDGQWPYAPP